ncbi:Flagellum site-determining protein YlxH [Polystyrenella longa]|uniref:Flagellum site-determining protein YlxH n=1 Tax=Polystyrenella longa TaxID=2528007 RepID=A0A518CGN1_9PLAN|nr:P-loop NTPase [Polystyrenella longa]QDU78386.1 Flagellum site-determining protein YlxH [Polystyrenella longa]
MTIEDQATALRGLAERFKKQCETPSLPRERRASTLAVTGGKGGVGRSTIALNLAISLSELGQKVCLVDATPGLGNLDLLCGLNCYWNLSHVISGARQIEEVITAGPGGIDVVVGANDLSQLEGIPATTMQELSRQLETLEENYDVLILDAGNALHSSTRPLLNLAEMFLIVTTPEPTAIADAYASIKRLSTMKPALIEVLVNQAHDANHAAQIFERVEATSRLFVQTRIQYAGLVPFDEQMTKAIWRRTPLLSYAPDSLAAKEIRKLGQRLLSSLQPDSTGSGQWKERLGGIFQKSTTSPDSLASVV